MRKELTMLRMKSIFAVLVLTAIVGVVPNAQAQTIKVVIAGSSALWQTLALGAYGGGTCNTVIGCTAGSTWHWTSAKSGSTEPYLNDARPTPANQDPGPIWVVWDGSATTPTNVWIFSKVDSVVGDRCYFAKPACTLVLPTGASLTGSNLITVWGATGDTNLPSSVATLLTSGIPVTVAATDIRPEDAAWAAARVNSALGASVYSDGGSDGLDGLGYNTNNAAGVPAVYPAGTTLGVGTPIKSGILPATGQQANVLAFNIIGKDPFSNTTVTAFSISPVGAAPIVFVNSRSNALSTLTNASELQLQQAFGGFKCDAEAFGLTSHGINVFLREPLSGTYNTVEATVFRRPTVYTGAAMAAGTGVLGISQETNVGAITATTNPLNAGSGSCLSSGNPDGKGARYRGIGTSEVIQGVQTSNTAFTTLQDGIAYAFFSYGNVSKLAGSSSYGYITLNGVDPIFASYSGNLDPGQPTQTSQGGLPAGTLPLNTPCGTGAAAFPCNEAQIWSNGFSFPNVRNGTYRSWSLLRLVATGTASTAAGELVKGSNQYVVTSVPDYIPYAAVTAGGTADFGLKLLRSHYLQRSGATGGPLLEKCTGNVAANSPECGGDMGGLIIPNAIGVTTYKRVQIVQDGTATSLGAVARPE